MRTLLLSASLALLLTACGFKGPLFLPKTDPAHTPPPAAKTAPLDASAAK